MQWKIDSKNLAEWAIERPAVLHGSFAFVTFVLSLESCSLIKMLSRRKRLDKRVPAALILYTEGLVEAELPSLFHGLQRLKKPHWSAYIQTVDQNVISVNINRPIGSVSWRN